jgi:hypothetical protein
MARGGSKNSITGDVSGSVVAHNVYGDVHIHGSPPSDQTPTAPWARIVHHSKVWSDGQDRRAAVTVATQLAALNQDLPDDPWLDRGLPERFTKRVSWLAGKLDVEFGAAEATLLVLIPLLHQVLWTRAAADRLDGPPPEFYRDHSRLAARMDGHDEVRWWLFHRWLWLQAEVLKPESIAELLADVDVPPVLTASRVSGLLKGLRGERPESGQRETLCGGSENEEHVRTPLLGLLLAVAYKMAIDVTSLSDVIAWHTPVDFERLHETIADATWVPRADCPVLSAACHHASVVEALREHTASLDALLHTVRNAADEHTVLAPLHALPERASSDDVMAAKGPDGKPVFSGWSRFHMDENQVQELLMGEQLYRDRSLAIRELYQNALDACRYRRAREEYLRRTIDRSSDWTGRITFTQGIDADDRPYLDCVDNGIGMGVEELTGVFAKAGGRFTQQPEFRDEQVDWSRLDPPIELFPNSRFGIGVLSYFMLADEITITTCRMSRKTGLAGPVHEVAITGPGHLFEIRKTADQGKPGTTVRLYLRAGVRASCVEALNRLLAIAEFDTTAQHGERQAIWTSGVFEHRVGQEDLSAGTIVASAEGNVIWCEDGGALLVDGLRVDHQDGRPGYRGSVVNLTGALAPRLSVDRTTVLESVGHRVAELQARAVPDLIAANTLLASDWLNELGFENPRLADMIVENSPGLRCFPADWILLTAPPRRRVNRNILGGHPLDHIFLWRLIANAAVGELAELVPEIAEAGTPLPPRPSDLRILCTANRSRWASVAQLRAPGRIVAAAAELAVAPRSVADRLTQLGIDGIGVDRFPTASFRSYALELDLLGEGDNNPRLLSRRWWEQTVPMPDLAASAAKHGIAASEAVDIVSAYGLTVGPPARSAVDSAEELTGTALPDSLATAGAGVLAGIADVREPIPLGHVLSRAEMLDMPVAEAVRILSTLGLTPPDVPGTVSAEDIRLVSVNLNGSAPWLDIRRPVRLHHLIKAHAVLNQSPFWASDRLSQLGFTVQQDNLPYYPEYRDLTLLREEEFTEGFLDPEQPVPLSQLVMLSKQLSSPFNQIVGRLRELGMNVPDLKTTIRNALAKVPLEK